MTGPADCVHQDFFAIDDDYVCRLCGKRLAPVGFTRVTTATGTRWVKYAPRKRRKPGRALRFANIAIGAELVCVHWHANDQVTPETMPRYVVTDLWFDPVAGERDPIAGQMVAIRTLRDGQPIGSKCPHTRRGLAMQGYHYAEDYLARWRATSADVAQQIERARANGR